MIRVTLELQQLRCISQFDHQPNDPAEPYLWVNFFFFDHTTASAPDGPVRTVNMLDGESCRNVLPENIKAGTKVAIPAKLGRFQVVLDESVPVFGHLPVFGFIVALLEENSTSEDLMVGGHKTFGKSLHEQINAVAIRSGGTLDDAAKKQIADAVQKAVLDDIHSHAGFLELFRSADRMVGFASEVFSWDVMKLLLDKAAGKPYPLLEQIRQDRQVLFPPAPVPFGIPPRLITVTDSYEIDGSITIDPFTPPAPDPCQAQKDAFAKANAAVAESDRLIARLKTQLAQAPASEKPGIQQEIADARAERALQVKARDKAFTALQQCRAAHPGSIASATK